MASQEYYYNLFKNQNKEQLDKDIADINAQYDASEKIVKDNYNAQIAEANDNYIDLHRKNETQRLLNQRYIERKAAEMGLTDSGFNRTQQTAAQLGYTTTQADYFMQQQKAVDTLALAMNSKLTELATGRNTDINNTYRAYDESATKYANELYKADLEAEAEAEKARIKAEQDAQKEYRTTIKNLESQMLSDMDDDKKLSILNRYESILSYDDWKYLLNLAGKALPQVNTRNVQHVWDLMPHEKYGWGMPSKENNQWHIPMAIK